MLYASHRLPPPRPVLYLTKHIAFFSLAYSCCNQTHSTPDRDAADKRTSSILPFRTHLALAFIPSYSWPSIQRQPPTKATIPFIPRIRAPISQPPPHSLSFISSHSSFPINHNHNHGHRYRSCLASSTLVRSHLQTSPVRSTGPICFRPTNCSHLALEQGSRSQRAGQRTRTSRKARTAQSTPIEARSIRNPSSRPRRRFRRCTRREMVGRRAGECFLLCACLSTNIPIDAQPAPPSSLTSILDSFRRSGEGDRELLLSILGAKKAEEEVRLGSYPFTLFLLRTSPQP